MPEVIPFRETDKMKGGKAFTDFVLRVEESRSKMNLYAEAVTKSYPGFFEDYRALGGEAEEI